MGINSESHDLEVGKSNSLPKSFIPTIFTHSVKADSHQASAPRSRDKMLACRGCTDDRVVHLMLHEKKKIADRDRLGG
jgi:hypothetical protein